MSDLPTSAAPAAGQAPAPQPGAGEPPPPLARPRWWSGRQSSRRTPDRPCLNCGDPTVGQFCPACGQRKVDVRVSLRRMLREVMDDQLSVNSTLPRTLVALLIKPGRLTNDYVQGRMVRYIPPFRLYLVSSLLFFIVISFIADPREMSINDDGQARVDSIRVSRIADSVLLAHARRAGEDTVPLAAAVTRARAQAPADELTIGLDSATVPPLLRPVARRMKAVETRLNAMPRGEALRTLMEAFEENAPLGVFVMMPLFALILKLLYVRRKRFYVEHFVFALHVHAFAFLTLTMILLIPSPLVGTLLLIWFLVYLFVALRRVYGQGVVRTLLKYFALGISYSFLLIVGVIATALLTALSL